ncbi:MAG TPA: SDR family NAD(P)-dependent oxidoreductase [Aliidongia sp.]|uniref:SDR family NAD(P)-dependent oxidoreductase n=1 Tax=Aliidongia sp. TaxID=1914230 RepID=UPI002DDD339B|nr:SDR family NAD(P)-dependent oxidoreductase [Aliidongia sp.]HEV2677940.1 SDR family NAD(P)-dependent oxidoreductase [Aliidongia sp.]
MSATRPPKAVVVGVGAEAGLGAALCRRFAAEGYHVLVAGTTPAKVEQVADTIRRSGGLATAVPTDTTREADVVALFDRAATDDDAGPLDLVVYNAGSNRPHDFQTMSVEWFEETWRVGCLGGFLIGREAARRLAPLGRGTILFTGASASLRGRPNFAAFSAAKAGLRMVAQAMAREFGPQGLHVAHVVIDGGIDGERLNSRMPARRAEKGPDGMLQLDQIAEAYWQLHRQQRSAWTQEIDLRPFVEPF